jgi:non-ribosomal peptide synthetase component F
MVLLSALAVLVHRQAGPDEVVVGVPVANREDAKWHGTYGLFVNTVAVRVSLAGYPTFREVLDRTSQAAMQALAHQEAPFDQVVARVVKSRSGDTNPVFQIACVLADRPWRLELPGVAAEFLQLSTGAVKYELKLSLVREEQGITAEFEYSTGLLSPEAVSWMASAYLNILHQLVDSPNRAVEGFVLEEGSH